MTTRTILASMALCIGIFSANAGVEPLATLNVASLEKLGTAISQLSATFEQPMLGALAMGSIQQYLQSTLGTCNQAKPAAIVLFGDPAEIQGLPANKIMSAIKIGLIFPLGEAVDQYLAGKQLKKGADGFVDIPDGAGSLKATFEQDYAFISQQAPIATTVKQNKAKFLQVPGNGNVLSFQLAKQGISIYKKTMLSMTKEEEKKPVAASMTKFNEKMMETMSAQLDQYASLNFAIGFDPAKGLKFDTAVAYAPNSEMRKLASTAQPYSPSLLSAIPDSAFCYLAYSASSPEAAYQVKSYDSILGALTELVHSSLDASQPAFAAALCDLLGSQAKCASAIDQSVCAIGYHPATCLWTMQKFIEKPGAKGVAHKATREAYAKLAAAADKAFPGQEVLALTAEGGMTMDLSKLDVKAVITTLASSGEKNITPEKKAELDATAEMFAPITLAVLKSLFGEKSLVSLQQTPDGFVSRFSATGADPAIVKFWSAPAGAKASADIAKVSTGAKPVQTAYFTLYGLVKELGDGILKALPADNPAKAYAPALAALPPADSSIGIFSSTVARDGASRSACVISSGELKKIAAAVTALTSAGDKGEDAEKTDNDKKDEK